MSKIAPAFVKAKRAFSPALKTSTNPHFKSKYADLGMCLEAVNDALLENGIAVYQETFEDISGVTVETVFLHESGDSLRAGKLHVPASKQDAQGYGSALSYARRYSLMAACGIAPEDDDGNASKMPTIDRTMVMKVRNKIQEHIVNDRELGVAQEWDYARGVGEEFQSAVWSGLTTPEREYIRSANNRKAA
ncbi:ERF family protein [Methylibium sp.]|uniref:ERF family protein n=1 Tax=Methylibium sp. TaxID=2067992 RepID=UPI0017926947|nr:ERF family protein [Methylibium sp.]MBA3590369.1 ERF family protein [Methylibium sp.]